MHFIDSKHHPILSSIAQGASWIGQDAFPSCSEWAEESERWLRFTERKGQMRRYLPRLRGPAYQRDRALAEIKVAYFLEAKVGYSILEWEPIGATGKKGDFLISASSKRIFVEVKAPGWEKDIVDDEGRNSPRLKKPKYIHAEARSLGPWAVARRAVAGAYLQLPAHMPTLVVIADDYFIALTHQPLAVDIALYCPAAGPSAGGYLAEDGCFVGKRYERLGGVAVFNVVLRGTIPDYEFALFLNPNALPQTSLPQGIFPSYPTRDGTQVPS